MSIIWMSYMLNHLSGKICIVKSLFEESVHRIHDKIRLNIFSDKDSDVIDEEKKFTFDTNSLRRKQI